MKAIQKILIILLFPLLGFSQIEQNPLNSTPYIEVTGEGEIEVIPDEIYLQFTLKERYDGRTKINIDDLEKSLKRKLRLNGINLDDLSLADADAAYVKIRRKNKDVLASKDYIVEVSSTEELAKVWTVLDEIDALSAFIKRVDHSKMDEFKKEVKIKAIQHAKEKANYMLAAINQQTGKALFIREQQNFMLRNSAKMALQTGFMEQESIEDDAQEVEISFKKIKLKYEVFARFAID